MSRSLVTTLAVLCASTLPAAHTALAQGDGSEEEEIAPIIVSATRSEQSAVSTPASITVITREEIEASGAKHVVEVLRGRGGVQLSDLYGDGTRATISMRGFGANAASNSLILVDGRRLNNPDIGAPDLNSISLKDVERIEIVQGSAGTLFGDQAVGGVINIITRTPTAFSAAVSAEVGSYDTRTVRGHVADRLANGLSYRISGEDRSTDWYRDNNEQDYSNVLARVDFEHAEGSLFLEYQTVDEDLNTPGALTAQEVDADRRQTTHPGEFSDTETDVLRVGMKHMLSPNWQLEAEVSSRDSDNVSNFGPLFGNVLSDRKVKEFTPRLIGNYGNRFGDILLTIGMDLGDSDYTLGSIFGTSSDDQDTWSFYAQAVVPVSESITLTAGGRTAHVEDNFEPSGLELDDDVTVWELGLSWQASPEWRLFARADENFRFPKADEQTFTAPGVIGLDTQTGTSYELGAEWRRGWNAAKALVYRLDLDDEIDFDPSVGPFGANNNLDPTERYGLILEASFNPIDDLTLSAQYSYVDAEFTDGPFDGNDIPFVAEHVARLSADYRIGQRWNLFGELQYISDRVPSGDYANELDELDGHTVFNMSARYTHRNWLASARINNVFAEEYSDLAVRVDPFLGPAYTGFYPAPERNAFLTVQYNFN